MAAGATGLAFAPFVPFGNFMPNPSSASLLKVPAKYGKDGTVANVNTFPINHSEVVTYPSTGDAVLDSEAFRKWQLIRLPEELGGANNTAEAFRIFSMVCLHLWCLWEYKPEMKNLSCPCHGSTYEPIEGEAIGGPASVQAAPSNILPKLDLEVDSAGDLYILPPKFDSNNNGVVGFGRFV